MELVCENESDSILIINFFYTVLFNEKINIIKQKNFNIENIIKEKWLNERFKNIIEYVPSKTNIDKNNTHELYQYMKMLWKVELYNSESNETKFCHVEFRVSLKWNKEKDIFLSDQIYNLWKLILASIRLDWYVTQNYINILINEFLSNDEEMDKKINCKHLFDHLTKNFIEIKRASSHSNIYTSSERYNTLHWTEFYPENFSKTE